MSAPGGSELGRLADPEQLAEPLALHGEPASRLERFLRVMLQIRIVEEVVAEWVERGVARAPCHLGIGQEAIAVGVSAHLEPRDRVFGGHRSHAHYLALGGDVYRLLAEILGRDDGASRGMGGSMHLVDRSVGFHGSVPLVGATIPIAVGAGLAAKMDGEGAVAVSYFGDGASEEGVLHESFNLAATFGIPVLFVCENNLYSSHLDIAQRQPSDRVARFGEAHRIPSVSVDGNDVLAVARAAAPLIERARASEGAALLEAVTYRHRGHVGPKEDVDVGLRRSLAELAAWKRRDPIRRLSDAMLANGLLDRGTLAARERALRSEIAALAARAEAAPEPPQSALLDYVFAGPAR
jgi:pyruvate dehydrogenase E1 component alpha subunit